MQWIGVDGGGTKTLFELYDNDMNMLQQLRLPTCHAGQVGYDGMHAVLAEGVEHSRRQLVTRWALALA